MAIKDYSGWPDSKLPKWVLQARNNRRERERRYRYYNERGEDGRTQHERDIENGTK